MNALYVIMAIGETVSGLMLLLAPALTVTLLLATSLETSLGLTLARLAGAALLALGIVCWFPPSGSARGLNLAMLVYNFAACVILAFAGMLSGLEGILLWPAVIYHAIMTLWCVSETFFLPTRWR